MASSWAKQAFDVFSNQFAILQVTTRGLWGYVAFCPIKMRLWSGWKGLVQVFVLVVLVIRRIMPNYYMLWITAGHPTKLTGEVRGTTLLLLTVTHVMYVYNSSSFGPKKYLCPDCRPGEVKSLSRWFNSWVSCPTLTNCKRVWKRGKVTGYRGCNVRH